MKHYTQITPPTVEPIAVADFVAFARTGGATEDAATIATLISVARGVVEDATGRALMLSGWRVVADGWTGGEITWHGDVMTLDRTPLVDVSSVKYYAEGATTLTTLSPADYVVITGTEPGSVQLLINPPALAERPDAVQIEFTAGAASPELVPAVLRHAVRLQAADYYEKRADLGKISDGIRHLLDSQRVAGWVA